MEGLAVSNGVVIRDTIGMQTDYTRSVGDRVSDDVGITNQRNSSGLLLRKLNQGTIMGI